MTMHRVQDGEKLSEIAKAYGTTTDQIVRWNPEKEAVVLPSGERVFATLSAGEDIELPGVLGDGELYPREFYERAFLALQPTTSMDLKSQEILDQVAYAAAAMKSAMAYLQTHPELVSEYKTKHLQDPIGLTTGTIANIDRLDSILRGIPVPGTNNYYTELAYAFERLGTEMDRWPKSAQSAASISFGPWFKQLAPTTPTGSFPSQSASWGGPAKVELPTNSAGPVTDTKVQPDVLPPKPGAKECAAQGGVFDVKTGECKVFSPEPSEPSEADPIMLLRAACTAKHGVFDEATRECRVQQTTSPPAAETGGVSTTKKGLIIAGAVVALGLAGFGAWRLFAKDKTGDKKPDEKPTP